MPSHFTSLLVCWLAVLLIKALLGKSGVKLVVAVLAVLRVVHLMSENLIKRFESIDLLP